MGFTAVRTTAKSSLGSVIAYQSALMSFRSFRNWRQSLWFSNAKHVSVSDRPTETATERAVRRHWVTWTLIPGAKVRLTGHKDRVFFVFVCLFVCFWVVVFTVSFFLFSFFFFWGGGGGR